jgi:hypothetical protein
MWINRYRRADPAFLDARYKQTLGASPPHDVPFAVYRRIARPHTFGRGQLHRQVVVQSLPSELHEISGTIKGMGLGGIVTDAYSHVRMERANRCSPRRQQRMSHGQL